MDDGPNKKIAIITENHSLQNDADSMHVFFSYPSPLHLPRLLDMFSWLETDSVPRLCGNRPKSMTAR